MSRLSTISALAVAGLTLSAAMPAPAEEVVHRSWTINLGAEQRFDTNLYAVGTGSLGQKEGWISRIEPRVEWSPELPISLSYEVAAERNWSARTEDHARHTLGARGKSEGNGAWSGSWSLQQTRVEGSREPLRFEAGRNAFTTAAARERRQQWQSRGSAEVTWAADNGFFLRGRGDLLLYDLQTRTTADPPPGFDNYIDRYEISGGVDLGLRPPSSQQLYLGLRQGYQHQGRQGGRTTDRSNHFQRILLGGEGSWGRLARWQAEAGPSFHHYDHGPGDLRQTSFFARISGQLKLGERDALAVQITHRPWVASTGRLSNRVFVSSLRWQHEPAPDWTASVGGSARALIYDGVEVEDWVYASSLHIAHQLTPSTRLVFDLERSLGRDEALDRPGRNYNRTALTLRWEQAF